MASGIGFDMRVDLSDVEKQLAKFAKFPQFAQPRLVHAMTDSLAMVEREAKQRAPVGVTGNLRSSIGGKVTFAAGTDVRGVVGSNVAYAAAVERGARAHFPPISNIAYWVDRKLELKNAFEIFGAALAIARGIAARGTRKQPFLMPGYQAVKGKVLDRFKRATDEMAEDLAVNGF